MEKLIEYLNTGSCIAFVGAGASAEIKIPAWKALATYVFNEATKVGHSNMPVIKEYFDSQKWPEFFGEVKRTFGQKYLYDICREKLKDTGKDGSVYSFLSKFPFQAYFTTNFDDALRRHLLGGATFPQGFLNTKKDFEGLDLDTLRGCVVKVHGDFSDESTLVLTDEQYERREVGYEFQYYRDCLSAYFQSKRIVFVGYSISDPDIQFLLKRIGLNLRRNVPLYAIVADARTSVIREWDRKYNIQVIRYNNNSGSHQELVALLEAIDKYLYVDGPPPPPRSEVDLKRAQSLYLWHRFQMEDSNMAVQVDALKSVLLSSIRESLGAEVPFVAEQVLSYVKTDLGLSIPLSMKYTEECLEALCKSSFLGKTSDSKFFLTKESSTLLGKFGSQHEKLLETFDEQVKFDFHRDLKNASAKDILEVQKGVRDVIADVFSERGVEIMNMIFGRRTVNTVQATNLFRLLNRRASAISSVQAKYKFIAYITKMLTAPTPLQERILDYFSSAFFSMQALKLDPQGRDFRDKFLRNRTIIVDSSIMIPLLAKNTANQYVFDKILKVARENGIQLITTSNLIEEVRAHAKWASDQINKYGEQSVEILGAALGRPPFDRNEFLDGFIRYCSEVKHLGFAEYLRYLVGSEFSDKSIKEFLVENYGITIFNFDVLSSVNPQSLFARDKLLEFVRNKADEAQIDKGDLRVRCESEAYAIIRYWDAFRPTASHDEEWQCSFLSQGGFLNRIARESEFPLQKNIVVKIDALYEFLIRFGGTDGKQIAFKDVLLSSYFRAAEYFVDKAKYSRFFSTLINEAERTYVEGLDKFRNYVNDTLTTSSMDEFPELERPLVVRALHDELSEQIRMKGNEIGHLKKEANKKEETISKLTTELQELQDKEARKKKYADKQRRRKKRRGK